MHRSDVPPLLSAEIPEKKRAKKREHVKKAIRDRPQTTLDAVLLGDIHSLRYLCLKQIAYPPTAEDSLAMRMACKAGNLEAIALLLEAGLDPLLGLEVSDNADVIQLLRRQPGISPLPIDRELDTEKIREMIDY